MNRRLLILFVNLLFCCVSLSAQDAEKSELQKRAESIDPKTNIASARSTFIHAFNDYANQGKIHQAVECAAKATALYYRENLYQEAFDLLRRADQTIAASKLSSSQSAACHYLTTKERLQMYIKMRRVESAKEQLKLLENHAVAASNDETTNDLLYTKASLPARSTTKSTKSIRRSSPMVASLEVPVLSPSPTAIIWHGKTLPTP